MTYYCYIGVEPSIATYEDSDAGQRRYEADMEEFERRQRHVDVERLCLPKRHIDQIASRLEELDRCREFDLAIARLDKAEHGGRLIDILPDDINCPELGQVRRYIMDLQLLENL